MSARKSATWQRFDRRHGQFRRWLLGEVLTVAAEAAGIISVFINDWVRDIAGMAGVAFQSSPVPF